jgi:O-antigen/teichoic acid export membrane protein
MKAILQRLLPKNSFARSVSVLAGGTAAGQATLILFSPVLTRLYNPDDFGVLAVFASILGILGVVVSMRYQLAILLPESDEEAAQVTMLSLLVVLGMATLSAIIIIFSRRWIAESLNTPALAGYLLMLPLSLLLMGVYDVLNYWAIRIKAFSAIARTKLTQSISMVTIQLGGFFLGPLALILGQVSGQAAGSTSLGALIVKKNWPLFKGFRWSEIRYAAIRYKRFPIYSTWGGVFNTAGQQLPPLLFAALFSPASAGIYMLANRVLALPMSLVGSAVANVFFSKAAEASRKGKLGQLVMGIHEKLAHLAMPPALILTFLGPDIFVIIFGKEWRQAGEFAQWMAPWIYLVFITSPLTTLFAILEKQAQGMLFQGILLFIRIGTLVTGARQQNEMLAVALFACGSALCYIGLLIWVFKASGNDWFFIVKPTLIAFSWGMILVSPLIINHLLIAHSGWLAFTSALTIILVASRYYHLLRKQFLAAEW